MKRRILPAAFFFFLLSAMAVALPMAAAAVIEHTFVVSQVGMTHLCEETLVTVVNGQLPGPVIEVTEGDSVAVHVINKSPYNMTIHWHGVKQRMNCWADGVPMITQCPIRPNHSFTYRFNVAGQEGTLWWHAHVSCLRGSVHGAFIIRPRHGASSYPFPKPHREVPLVIGEWWQTDLGQIDKSLTNGFFGFNPSSATINGKLGDLNNCSGGLVEEGYVLEVEAGKTYLLRLINAALMSEYYLKIAGHKFTVVAADANYVKPYTTDVIAIAPGETVDALLVADAAPERSYYMVALANQPSIANPPFPVTVTRGTLQYLNGDPAGGDAPPPVAPEMPDLHDMVPSFYFHGNLTSLRPHPRGRRTVPAHVDERLLVTLSMGSICRNGGESCKRGGRIESIIVSTMNNVSFQLPVAATTTLLAAHYNHSHNNSVNGTGELLYTPLPERPPWPTVQLHRPRLHPDRAHGHGGAAGADGESHDRAEVPVRRRGGGGVPEHGGDAERLQPDAPARPRHVRRGEGRAPVQPGGSASEEHGARPQPRLGCRPLRRG